MISTYVEYFGNNFNLIQRNSVKKRLKVAVQYKIIANLD